MQMTRLGMFTFTLGVLVLTARLHRAADSRTTYYPSDYRGQQTAGGLFGGSRMWGPAVNRDGALCAAAINQNDNTRCGPGVSRLPKPRHTPPTPSLDLVAALHR
jgi:hypothetical protein